MLLQFLEIQHESASWIWDAIRSILWFLAKGILILLDGIFLVINDIWKFKFFDNPYINKIYSAAIIVACTWLILKVILELIINYFINQDDNKSPTKIFKGIAFAIVMMYTIPSIFNWGYELSTKMTEYVISISSDINISSSTIESSISTMILTAFADNNKMTKEDKQFFIENWMNVDFNEVIDDGLFDSGKYKYSFSTFTIFLVGLIVIVLLFFIAIQVAKRIIELALYKAIAPFVCTSLTTNRSRAFEVWIKSVMGAFLVTTVQYLCMGILFNVFGQVSDNTTYTLSAILIVIGALIFIISSPQLISALLNTNTGFVSNISELHTLTAIGTSLLAVSSYSKTTDNSTNSSYSDNNSTYIGGQNNNDSNINNNISSNLDNSNKSSKSDYNISSNNNENNSDLNVVSPENMNNNTADTLNIHTTTSLAERIDVYKDITSSEHNLNNNSEFLYDSNNDWRETNVSNSKEY